MRTRKKRWLAAFIAGLILTVLVAAQHPAVQAQVEIWRCTSGMADHYSNISSLNNAPTYSQYMTSMRWQCQANVWHDFALAGESNEQRTRFAHEAIAAYTELITTLGQDTYLLPRAELLTLVGNQTAALADYNNLLATYPDNYWAQEQRGTLHAQMGDIEAARADFEALLTQAGRDPVNNHPAYIARIQEKLASLD